MYKLELTKKAEDKLNYLKNNDKNTFFILVSELKKLQKFWLNLTNIKNIWDNIFRKREWRWRILFTIDDFLITIWIIEIEKDTQKDYKMWKNYIISKM